MTINWANKIHNCIIIAKERSWSTDFLKSVERQLETKGYITNKQQQAILNIANGLKKMDDYEYIKTYSWGGRIGTGYDDNNDMTDFDMDFGGFSDF